MRAQQFKEITEQLHNGKHWHLMTLEIQFETIGYLVNRVLNRRTN